MNQLFDISIPNLINLKRFYKKAPKKFQKASANVLTSFAFGTRAEAMNVIKSKMVIRNPRFINSRLRVSKAFGSTNIGSQQSEVGSIPAQRFTGWIEQQTGKMPAKNRIFTLLARRGDITRQALPSARLKPGNKYISSDEFTGKTPNKRIIAMLQILGRKGYKKPFIIRRGNKFKKGLYKFKGSGKNKKILALQLFRTNKRPKKLEWLTMARDNYFRKNDVNKVWEKSLKQILKF